MHLLVNTINSKKKGWIYCQKTLLHFVAQNGLKVSVICHEDDAQMVPKHANISVLPQKFNNTPTSRLIWEQFKLPSVAAKLKPDATLSFSTTTPLIAKNPFILLAHNPELKVLHPQDKNYHRLNLALTWLSMVRCKTIFTNGLALGRELADGWDYLEKKLVRTPMGRDVSSTNSIMRDPKLVVAVGKITPRKNYDILLKAFAILRNRIPGLRLTIFGKPEDKTTVNEMIALITELNLKESVLVTPAPPETIFKNLTKATCCVNLSTRKNPSTTLMDALMCGVPTVCADIPAHRETAREDGAFYARIDNINTAHTHVATAIEKVLKEPQLAAKIGNNGKKYTQEFTWQHIAKTMLNEIAPTPPEQPEQSQTAA